MKICGIIAEYNPFHNGHEYQLKEAKNLTGCDYVVVCMSGDFVQRGLPAVGDKYSRAKAALLAGADLVIELPTIYATASAEYFAKGSIGLLNRLGCDDICFGSENGDIKLLENTARAMDAASEKYDDEIFSYIKNGMSYAKALDEILTLHGRELGLEFIMSPKANDKLGISYIRAINDLGSKMKPHAVKRLGDAYLDENGENSKMPSAMAIRGKLKLCEDPWSIREYIPDYSYETLFEDKNRSCPMYPNDFSDMMYMSLKAISACENAGERLTEYLDVSDNIAGKIQKNINRFSSVDRFITLIHSPEYTYSRIYRSLLHIMLDIKEDEVRDMLLDESSWYIRTLGFKKSSSGLLGELKKRTMCPIISKIADSGNVLSGSALKALKKDIYSADLYEHAASRKFDRDFISEFERSIVIL